MTALAQFRPPHQSATDDAQLAPPYWDDSLVTTGLADDFDSAIGTIGTITNPTSQFPTIVLTPDDQSDVSGWLMLYGRVSGLLGKRPTIQLDYTNFRGGIQVPNVANWAPVFRNVDDATVPSDGRPLDLTRFDNFTGEPLLTISNDSNFTANVVEFMHKPRWRYLDTQRAIAEIASHSFSSEQPSSVAFGGTQHVHAQTTLTSGQHNSAAGTTLDLHCIKVDDTSASPGAGLDKLNIVMMMRQHSSEDQGSWAGWEFVNYYLNATGTDADNLRQQCRLHIYDPNPAGGYYGAERWTEEQGTDMDQNRSWSGTGSSQTEAVKAAIALDVSRVDGLLDMHGSFGLGHSSSNLVGAYDSGGALQSEFKTAWEATSTIPFGDFGDIATTSAEVYFRDTLNAQLALTFELAIAINSTYPAMQGQYEPVATDIAKTIQKMLNDGDLVQPSTQVTIDAGAHEMGLSVNAATVLSGTSIQALLSEQSLQTSAASISLAAEIGAAVHSMALSVNPANVSAGVSIIAGVREIAMQAFPANVQSGVGIGAAVQAIVLEANPATVLTGTAIQTALAESVLEASPASIQSGQAVNAQAHAMALQAYQPGISLNIAIVGALHEIGLEALAASVGLASQVEAFAHAMELTPFGATVTLDGGIFAGSTDLELEVFSASVTGTQAELLAPGLEFTMPQGRLHYTFPINRIHFTFLEED